jgi:hypothetical protein
MLSRPNTVKKMARIIGNRPLAEAIYRSVDLALKSSDIQLAGDKAVWDIFERSLNAAIRDIEEHPRGELFRRLIEYGPPTDGPEVLESDDKTLLSDPECGSCVEFIYSHMVNRFKGELAELLALEPCISHVDELKQKGHISSGARLFWGDMIQEKNIKSGSEEFTKSWGNFTKGADGLIADLVGKAQESIEVQGVIEVKSMHRSAKKILSQINSHIARLGGGIRLGTDSWTPENITFTRLVRVMVLPSTWKISREWRIVKTDRGSTLVFPEPSDPPIKTKVQEIERDLWKITLAWSQEVLSEAAFEMTFWYMSQVGRNVYSKKDMPRTWSYMTPEEAGYNAIKQALFFIPTRYISERQMRLAVKLYNIYGYGYPLGSDARNIASAKKEKLAPNQILWPHHIFGEDEP